MLPFATRSSFRINKVDGFLICWLGTHSIRVYYTRIGRIGYCGVISCHSPGLKSSNSSGHWRFVATADISLGFDLTKILGYEWHHVSGYVFPLYRLLACWEVFICTGRAKSFRSAVFFDFVRKHSHMCQKFIWPRLWLHSISNLFNFNKTRLWKCHRAIICQTLFFLYRFLRFLETSTKGPSFSSFHSTLFLFLSLFYLLKQLLRALHKKLLRALNLKLLRALYKKLLRALNLKLLRALNLKLLRALYQTLLRAL